jgi:phosphomannomutase
MLPSLSLRDCAPAVGFGTSGVRALVFDLTPNVVSAYARAFVRRVSAYAGPPVECVVGWDLRPSSPVIAAAVCAGLEREGVRPVIEGACPTPALALRAAHLRAPAIIITGSHIPFDRNGIKFYTPTGEITKADEASIASMDAAALLEDETTLASAVAAWSVRTRGPVDGVAARDYAARLAAVAGSGLVGMRIGVYQHSAAGRDLLAALLERVGAQVVLLGRSDAFIPIDTEVVSADDERMAAAWCAQHRLDAIVSTDGDGDRPWVCDERGAFLRGDLLGALCARRLGADAVATPVSSNSVVEACGAFGHVARTRIGSPYVIEAMESLVRAGWTRVVGYEANGGFLTQSPLSVDGVELAPLPTRDSGLPILLALKIAHECGAPLSALADMVPARRTASGSLKGIPATESGVFLSRLQASEEFLAEFLAFSGALPISLDETDGMRVTLSSGDVVHLRPSGNAPEFRCYTEATTQQEADALLARALQAIEKRFHLGR